MSFRRRGDSARSNDQRAVQRPRLVADRNGLMAVSLGKSFKKRPVLRDVSVGVQRGEVVGLLGPNGAGKTTCFYMITGLLQPDYGWITLDGQVAWNFEREEAAKAVRRLPGVVGVTNLIVVKPRLKTVDVKEKIEEAFKRSAEIDAAHVKVDVDGAKVTLTGTVRSWMEYEDAANAAWSAAGVGSVENRLVVESGAAVF